ncbi:MAG: hypothetical protein R3B72_09305 [Polyangiaceae bacterium]
MKPVDVPAPAPAVTEDWLLDAMVTVVDDVAPPDPAVDPLFVALDD